jgi:hypothetical protein
MNMPQTNLVNSFEYEWLVSTFITFLILSSPGAGLACRRLLFKDLRTPPPQRYRSVVDGMSRNWHLALVRKWNIFHPF